MAIMLAANSAADKSSCPFGSLKLLEIISVSQSACIKMTECQTLKLWHAWIKAVRSHAYRTRILGACFLYQFFQPHVPKS